MMKSKYWINTIIPLSMFCFADLIWYKDIPLEFTTEGRQTVDEQQKDVDEDKKSEDNTD